MTLAFEHDPIPTYIHMYSFSGRHPNTGRQWRFLQGINLNYIPRSDRKRFVNQWVKVFEKSKGNILFTYKMAKRFFPYMDIAIRRYFYSPAYYIKNLKEVPVEDYQKIVIGSWHKDFSKTAYFQLIKKYKSAKRFMSLGGRI